MSVFGALASVQDSVGEGRYTVLRLSSPHSARTFALPPDPTRAWTAEIEWHAEGESRFCAVARATGAEETTAVAESPVPWPPINAASVQALADRVEDLAADLVACGWRALPTGSAWYARRFAWDPVAEPPHGLDGLRRRLPRVVSLRRGRAGVLAPLAARATARRLVMPSPSARESLRRSAPFALIVALVVLTRAVNLGTAWEIHVDEITYLRIAQDVAANLQVHLYGTPFFLHPPAFFFLEAGYLRALPGPPDLIDAIVHVRYLNVAFAAVTGAAVFWIVRELGGRRIAYLGAIAFALEPFIGKMTSRNLLDTSAMMWIALGMVVILSRDRQAVRMTMPRTAGAGALFGLAFLTKDMTVLPIAITLMAAGLLRCDLRLADSARILGVALLTYAPYPLFAWASGDWAAFVADKNQGFLRFLGNIKISGFRHGGEGPSFLEATLANLDNLASTYVLIGVGLPAAIVLFRLGDGRQRLLAIWCASSYVLLGYTVAHGTLEEQFFYLLVVPALMTTLVAVHAASSALVGRDASRRALWIVAVAVQVVFFAWALATWATVHFTRDDGYAQLVSHLRRTSTPDRAISVTTETSKFVLERYDRGAWLTPEAIRANDVRYVLISTYEMNHGYGLATRKLYEWAAAHGDLDFTFQRTRQDDRLLLFKLRETR
jgi:4-amino-4-deoxy-L-arabinose transferase-like glycosyltransferase